MANARSGAVIFAADPQRLAAFYEALAGLQREAGDDDHVVLASGAFELVLHALRGEPAVATPAPVREDTYIKPVFAVNDLDEVRARLAALGGRLAEPIEGWEGRGFRACEAVDPEGNRIQFRAALHDTR